MRADDHPRRDDRVLPFTRGLSLFIVPFLVVAWVILYLFPDHTARIWAWPIPTTMTSMVLASAYLGGAYFFARVFRERRWHHTGTGFLAVTMFATLLGITTLLHWNKFLHSHLAFWLWAGLYFTTPFLVIGAWLVNRRYAAPPAQGDVLLRPAERWVIAVIGLAALVTAGPDPPRCGAGARRADQRPRAHLAAAARPVRDARRVGIPVGGLRAPPASGVTPA
jgi:hypothetical protein